VAASKLRIAGGTARGVPLAEPRGVRLRPTAGRVREALFNILGERVVGAAVLDLYAGTGALGIEALSRGAAHATFVEADGQCCAAIVQSLARTRLAEAATVLRGRLPKALANLQGPFDVILADPPYDEPEAEETLLAAGELLAADGVVVYEHASRYNPPDRLGGLVLADRRDYGDSSLSFYRRQERR
jgi:16S rRNA (guanine(966)-N(2))-methyltransferase RsmD